jgi:hypothetical protein
MSYGMVAPFDAGQRFQWRVRIRSEEDLSLYTVLSGRADRIYRHTSPAPVSVQCSRRQGSSAAHARRLLHPRQKGKDPFHRQRPARTRRKYHRAPARSNHTPPVPKIFLTTHGTERKLRQGWEIHSCRNSVRWNETSIVNNRCQLCPMPTRQG